MRVFLFAFLSIGAHGLSSMESKCDFSNQTVRRHKAAVVQALISAETLEKLNREKSFIAPSDEFLAIDREGDRVLREAAGDAMDSVQDCVTDSVHTQRSCMQEINATLLLGFELAAVLDQQLKCNGLDGPMREWLDKVIDRFRFKLNGFAEATVNEILRLKVTLPQELIDLTPICYAYDLRVEALEISGESPSDLAKLRDQRTRICGVK